MDANYDPESPDAAPLDGSGSPSPGDPTDFDLSPRTSPSSGRGTPAGSTRRYVAIGALAMVVVALAAVLFIGLNDAATFFYNVDEAVAQHDQLGTERFRMQGNVVEGSVSETGDGVDFVITYGGVEVPVHHTGAPPELFGPDIPVVIEGSFAGDEFRSDEILIRHDNEYDQEHPDRVNQAEDDARTNDADQGGAEGVG